MNKVILNEFKHKYVIVDIIFYCMIVLLGFLILNCADMGLANPIKHAPCMFFSLAFLSLLAYFINRRKGDYEFLFFGFINIVVGTFILVYTAYPNSGFILADAVLLYSIANVLNKGYSCNKLVADKDLNFFTKISITILLLFLGVFVVASLYNKVEVGIFILGYYFIIFGLLSLLEPLNSVILKDPDLQKRIFNALSYSDVKKEKEVVHKEEVEVEEEPEEKKEEVKKTVTRKTPVRRTTAKNTTKKTVGKVKKTATVRKTPAKRVSTKKTSKK